MSQSQDSNNSDNTDKYNINQESANKIKYPKNKKIKKLDRRKNKCNKKSNLKESINDSDTKIKNRSKKIQIM